MPENTSAQILLNSFGTNSNFQRKEKFKMPENGSINEGTHGATTGNPGSTGTGTGAALSQTAQGYGEKISEVATHAKDYAAQAKDYVSDKVSVVGDKLKDLQNADIGELAENAKEYARKKPGQALLISAGVGLLLGMLLRGRR